MAQKYYYQVAVASKSYQGSEALTYSSTDKLLIGLVVKITLKSKEVYGFIISEVPQPNFKVSSIVEPSPLYRIPSGHLALFDWMGRYYPSPLGPLASHFTVTPDDLLTPPQQNAATEQVRPPGLPELSMDQMKAMQKIKDHKGSVLLHGETGTGKTRVYLELAKKAFSAKKSVVILTPEIALTAPLATQFSQHLGKDNVILNHSNLSLKQKKSTWLEIAHATRPLVVIGPRSTLFLPLAKIGLVVVDEAHDQAYKQESAPYYHANRVASMLSRLNNALLIYGSATPPVSEYYVAKSKNIPIVRMKKLASSDVKTGTTVKIVDLKSSQEVTNYPLISKSLLSSIERKLKSRQQILLFLNKRGTSRSVLCQDCGWKISCPNCDIALTFHEDRHNLLCHTCGYTCSPPKNCLECGSVDIFFKSPGTKAIETSLKKAFPSSTVARFDKDNIKKDRIESRYQEVSTGKIDILIGTQLLSKGHDLPRLGLAAMLSADNSLMFPDYTSEEKTYQLIRQLYGRINRGHTSNGEFIIQTYSPNSQLIKQATEGSYEEFYEQQIKQRELLGFPPFMHSLKIESSAVKKNTAIKRLDEACSRLNRVNKLKIIGPSPAFKEKRSGKFYWQVIVCAKNRQLLADVSKNIKAPLKAELDPTNFL